MATPTPAAQLPTRQQLDEIDALLSRMLTLPPLGGETAEGPPVAAEPPAPPPVEMTFPAPIIREVPAPRPPAPEDPVVREWRVQWPQAPRPAAPQPSVVAWGLAVPLATPAEEPYEPAPAPPYGPTAYQSPASIPPVAEYPLAEPVPTVPAPARPLVSPVLWPLIGLNAVLDVLSHLLGPAGAWTRGPGRTGLGWVGVAMILAAGVWAAGEWYGYNWPKVDLAGLRLAP